MVRSQTLHHPCTRILGLIDTNSQNLVLALCFQGDISMVRRAAFRKDASPTHSPLLSVLTVCSPVVCATNEQSSDAGVSAFELLAHTKFSISASQKARASASLSLLLSDTLGKRRALANAFNRRRFNNFIPSSNESVSSLALRLVAHVSRRFLRTLCVF